MIKARERKMMLKMFRRKGGVLLATAAQTIAMVGTFKILFYCYVV